MGKLLGLSVLAVLGLFFGSFFIQFFFDKRELDRMCDADPGFSTRGGSVADVIRFENMTRLGIPNSYLYKVGQPIQVRKSGTADIYQTYELVSPAKCESEGSREFVRIYEKCARLSEAVDQPELIVRANQTSGVISWLSKYIRHETALYEGDTILGRRVMFSMASRILFKFDAPVRCGEASALKEDWILDMVQAANQS